MSIKQSFLIFIEEKYQLYVKITVWKLVLGY